MFAKIDLDQGVRRTIVGVDARIINHDKTPIS